MTYRQTVLIGVARRVEVSADNQRDVEKAVAMMTSPPVVVPGSDERTLRDWFAGQALVGMLGDPKRTGTFIGYASDAYACADAMLAERAKDRKP